MIVEMSRLLSQNLIQKFAHIAEAYIYHQEIIA